MAYERWIFVGLLGGALATACGSDDDDGGSSGGTGGSAAGSGGTGGSATGGDSTGGTSPGGTTSGGTTSGGTTSGGDGGGGTGGASADGGGPISLTYTVVEAAGDVGNESGLAGVEVCVVDENLDKVDATNLCATTDSDGVFTIEGLTPGEQILLQYTLEGYTGGLSAVTLGTADMAPAASFRMPPNPADGGTFRPPGWDPAVTVDSAKGSLNAVAIVATAVEGGTGDTGNGFDWATGVSFSITPSVGDGPLYVDTAEAFVSGATETSGGWGAWFINLDPDTYEVSASHATMTCSSVGNMWGWMNTDGTADVPVYAGTNTQSIVFLCAAP